RLRVAGEPVQDEGAPGVAGGGIRLSAREKGSGHAGPSYRGGDYRSAGQACRGGCGAHALHRGRSTRQDHDDHHEGASMPYPFLSEEWLAQARRIRAEFDGQSVTFPHPVRMNLVVTAVPFDEKDIDAHMDTSSGELVLDEGHLDSPDLTVTVDYDTAKAILIDGN